MFPYNGTKVGVGLNKFILVSVREPRLSKTEKSLYKETSLFMFRLVSYGETFHATFQKAKNILRILFNLDR